MLKCLFPAIRPWNSWLWVYFVGLLHGAHIKLHCMFTLQTLASAYIASLGTIGWSHWVFQEWPPLPPCCLQQFGADHTHDSNILMGGRASNEDVWTFPVSFPYPPPPSNPSPSFDLDKAPLSSSLGESITRWCLKIVFCCKSSILSQVVANQTSAIGCVARSILGGTMQVRQCSQSALASKLALLQVCCKETVTQNSTKTHEYGKG